MAKFVLAGRTDCSHFAKAELLADALQISLPDFRIHKIPILPEEWNDWLKETCKANGWKHEDSPLIWRELVEQGGTGMLLGGFSDFLEHCQHYYNMSSDMSTDLMVSIAAENLEAKLNLVEEEKERARLIKSLNIWISSALNPTCNFLIPELFSAQVFPHVAAINLYLLDVEGDLQGLRALRMEVEDLALPRLNRVSIHTDVEQAFKDADFVLIQDESLSEDPDLEDEEEKKARRIKQISERYKKYGHQLDTKANKEVKVIVCGDSFVNLRCSLLIDSASSIDSSHFVAVATQLENQAKAILAKRLQVLPSDIIDVVVWGNISGSFYVDLQRTNVLNFNGAIKGPSFFSQPLLRIFHDRKWLDTEFQDLVRDRQRAIALKTCQTNAMSAANGILTILKALNGMCSSEKIYSVGVQCPGSYNLPEDIVISLPVTFADCKWAVLPDMSVSDELNERLQAYAREIVQEKTLASGSSDEKDDSREKEDS